MVKNKSSLPASVRIAFVVFVALGIIIIGFIWMSLNDWKDKNAELSAAVDAYAERVESKQERLDETVDEDYIKELARESGYGLPGEEFYPLENED